MAIIRPAAAHDLARIEEIYDAIHTAEEAGNVSIGWVRGVYPTRATAQAALDALHAMFPAARVHESAKKAGVSAVFLTVTKPEKPHNTK